MPRWKHPGTHDGALLEEGGAMRRFLIVGVLLGVVVGVFAACSDSSSDDESAALQLKADTYEIGRIEERFHQAMTLKDIDEMMSLWAPNATLTVGPDLTAAGVDEIRQFWLTKSLAFAPETTWVSDHPAYKLAVTVDGDRGTLHFECHFLDYKSDEVAAVTVGDLDVSRIDGQWLITNFVAGSTELAP